MKSRNFKRETVFVCEKDRKRLLLCKGKYSLYYRCPNYELKNRGPNENVCMNRMSIYDRNLLIDELEYLNDEEKLIVGTEGCINAIRYKVIDINNTFIIVSIFHKR